MSHGHARHHGHAHGHSHSLVDDSIKRSHAGLRAVGLSLLVLGLTAAAQLLVYLRSDSIALLADLIHNAGDAATAIPLAIAFLLRSPRAERIAGLFVVLAIFVSACVAGYEAIVRLLDPQAPDALLALAAAGALGFIGNWIAAIIRTRAGQRLDSPALIADGAHARADSYVSLAVIASAAVVAIGLPIADPLIGLAITLVILRITWQSWRTVRDGDARATPDSSSSTAPAHRAGRYREPVREIHEGMAPTLFLIVGLPGAGKTVRARELAAERGALLMTPDAWMISLFGQSQPGGKRDLLEGRLIALAIEALRLGLSVVLDFGLWGRDERSALRWMAARLGAACQVIYLSVDREVQLSRVRARWEHAPEQTFPMSEAELDAWRSRFDVPDADELSNASLPSAPPGDDSWFDWAARRWPSLYESVQPATHRAMLARCVTSI